MNDIIKDTAVHLCREIGARASGSTAEEKAAIYLKGRFNEAGVDAQIEYFKSPSHRATESRIFLAEEHLDFTSLPVLFSPGGKASGKLLCLGQGTRYNVPIEGRIGIWVPGEKDSIFTRNETAGKFEKRGLAGLIVICSKYYSIDTKIVRSPELRKMPVVSVSVETGTELMKYAGNTLVMEVEQDTADRGQSQNVVAKIPGTGENWLFVGAHYDTAPFCQGATDNTGGTAVLLGIADMLKKEKLPADVYIAAFGSEEHGALDGTGRGPWDFLKRRADILSLCIGYVNIDSVGNMPGNPQISISGPGRFKTTVLNTKKSIDYLVKEKYPIPSGDFGPAEMHGIPYAWFHDRVFPYLHTPEDTLKHLDIEMLKNCAKDAAEVIKALSRTNLPYPTVRKDGITARQARHSDIPAICEITSAAFEPVSMGRMKQDFFGEKLGGKNWDEYKNSELENFCKNNIYRVIIAEKDNRVVGYATYELHEEQGIAEIGNNAVHPDFQGKGIGKLMQAEIKRRMEEEGYEKFTVTTLSNDIPAQKVYEKLGYEKYIESHHYLKKTG